MARVSIYVPDELKARMDAAGELNWSAAAQRAFEVEINLQRWKMETDVIEKAAARLRAGREKYEAGRHAGGRATGRRWALEDADYTAVKALVGYSEDKAIIEASTLSSLILGDEDPSHVEVRDLWEQLLGDDFRGAEPGLAWIEGFVEGAGEVWEAVADKI
jgi:hypothetical protein